MGRARTGKPRGRAPAFSGEKLDFLDSFKDVFLGRADAGSLYDDIERQWFEKYGFDLPLIQNPPVDAPPVNLDLSGLPIEDQLQIQQSRKTIRKDFRIKLGNFLRHRFEYKTSDQDAVEEVIDNVTEAASTRPRKKSVIDLYYELRYESHLKAPFDGMWAKAKETLPDGASPVVLRNEFVKTAYEAESKDFRLELEIEVNKRNKDAMDTYKRKGKWDQSAEAYLHAWVTADDYLPLLADGVSKKTGTYTIIICVGPLGSENGEIVVRSAHSSTAEGKTKKIWPEVDPQGYGQMQESLVKFGRAFFPPEECQRRIVKKVESDESTTVKAADSPAANATPSAASEITTIDNASTSTVSSSTVPPPSASPSLRDAVIGNGTIAPAGPSTSETPALPSSSSAPPSLTPIPGSTLTQNHLAPAGYTLPFNPMDFVGSVLDASTEMTNSTKVDWVDGDLALQSGMLSMENGWNGTPVTQTVGEEIDWGRMAGVDGLGFDWEALGMGLDMQSSHDHSFLPATQNMSLSSTSSTISTLPHAYDTYQVVATPSMMGNAHTFTQALLAPLRPSIDPSFTSATLMLPSEPGPSSYCLPPTLAGASTPSTVAENATSSSFLPPAPALTLPHNPSTNSITDPSLAVGKLTLPTAQPPAAAPPATTPTNPSQAPPQLPASLKRPTDAPSNSPQNSSTSSEAIVDPHAPGKSMSKSAKKAGGKGGENVTVKEKSGRGGVRKRKSDEVDTALEVESRGRVRRAPAHLIDNGYVAPKKGAGRSTKK